MSKFIFNLWFLCIPFLALAQENEETRLVKNSDSCHQLRLGFDLSKIVQQQLYQYRVSYELSLDYYHKKELYWVLEAGLGSSIVDYPDLKYKSENTFGRLGIEKSLFARKRSNDWGLGFFGFRYGLGFAQRAEAQFTTNDGLGGITSGLVAPQNFTLHWVELVGGMKIELIKGLFAGWTVRAKFLLNPKAMGDLKPNFIAGYGPGEKATAFDYNFYLAYAIRWSKSRR